MTSDDKNTNQDIQIAVNQQILKDINRRLDCFVGKIDKFDKNLTDIIKSFNQDKTHVKVWAEEKFVNKEEFKPLKEIYAKGTMLGWIMFFAVIGVITAIITFLKGR